MMRMLDSRPHPRLLPLTSLAILGAFLAVPTRAEAPTAAERIRADVVRLAGDDWLGRRAGTDGADKAAAWIAERFRTLGLEPGGGDGSYFQAFSFIDGVTLGHGNRLATRAGGASRSWSPGEDFRPLAFSAPGAVSGEVVFAGYGLIAKDLDYDDYGSIDVKDRIVLVLRYGPGGNDNHSKWAAFTPLRLKAANAREKGARALLVATGPATPDAKDELVPLRADASLSDSGLPAFSIKKAVAEALFAGSGTSLDVLQQALDHTTKAAPRPLPARLEAVADLSPKRSTTRNVVGVLPRTTGGTAESIVVGAHYDHLGLGPVGSLDPAPDGKIHHGADDNASGVAGVLELAHRFARGGPAQGRTLVFVAFGAEELGTLGSSYFVKNVPASTGHVAAMVNMDMIGRLREDALDVHGVGTSPVWKTVLDEANRSAKLKLKIHEGGYGPSDHTPFYAAGIPVFFVFTGNHADYHRPSDTADKINAEGIERVLALVEPMVASLASPSTTDIAFVRVPAEKEDQGATGARGFRVWLGGIPDYSAEVTGVRLTGVSPGSPAEGAGLLAGDVLIRLGSREIRNIYDYTYALGDYKPGDRVTAVVQREGREVSVEVVLAARPSATR
jgi:aminopeptidase YwaD